jgi:FkbM family methyltransferase
MTFTSYAQNFEDVMLWRALSHIERGFYIDIGAQDPIVDSVSLAFHEHGWHGVHVEPTPHYAEMLRQQRPGDTVIQAAVGNDATVFQFFEIPGTGISTAVAAIAAQHREIGYEIHEILVPCITLSAIFDVVKEPEIHWLKIDVEGFERQVLKSWGTSTARPWIVVVESTLPLTQIETQGSWENIIIAYGYSPVYFDGLNRYYVSDAHSEIKAAFRMPPNYFDGFALSGTSGAPFHKLIEARNQEHERLLLAETDRIRRELEVSTNRERELAEQISVVHDSQQQTEATAQRLVARERELTQQLEDARSSLTRQRSAYEAELERGRKKDAVAAELRREKEAVTVELRREKEAVAEELRREITRMRERHEQQTSIYLDQLKYLGDSLIALSVRLSESAHKGLGSRLRGRFAHIAPSAVVNVLRKVQGNLINAPDMTIDTPLFTRANYQPSFVANSAGVYRLEDFLVLHDRNFVRAAYTAILRRNPDSDGEAHYLQQVRLGEHKAELLDQILRSEEARKYQTEIHGLQMRLRLKKICEFPVIGRVISALSFFLSIDDHMRDLRVLENHVIRIAEEAQTVSEFNLQKLRPPIK